VIDFLIETAGRSGSAATSARPADTCISAEWIWLIRVGMSAAGTGLLLT
jgi:hypothetical protein